MEDKNQSTAKDELKQLLCDELDKKQPDRKTVLMMLETLEQKENKNSRKQKRMRRLRKVAIAAAVVLAFVFVTPPVFGAENIFELIGRWTRDTFSFGNTEATVDLQQGYVFQTDHPGLQQLHDMVLACGISERVVPTWLPDGYELTELKKSEDLNGSSIYAKFEGYSDKLVFFLSPVNDDYCNKYAKDEKNVVVFEAAGVKHYLMQNEGQWIAAWCVDSLACSITTYGGRDTICQIIESIYAEVE